MTLLARQILAQMREARVPMSIADFKHRLGVEAADVMIALHDLEQAGTVRTKLRGVVQRPYYELV